MVKKFSQIIVEQLFKRLKEKNIEFCVLRNYEGYPKHIGNDIDILALRKDARVIGEIVQEIADGVNGRIWDYCGKKDELRMPLAVFKVHENKKIEAVYLDFLFRVEKFEFEYIDVQSVLNSKIPFKNFFILDKETEFLHILLQGIFNADAKHRERYKEKIKNYLSERRDIPHAHVHRIFPAFIASSIVKNLVRGRVDKIFSGQQIKKLLFIAKNGLFFKKILRYFPRKFKKLFKLFYPKGYFVVILGPDGVGKSTTAELLYKLLWCFDISACHLHLGFRPRFLPVRQRLGIGEPTPLSDKGISPKVRWGVFFKVRDLLRYLYHLTDYIFTYYFLIKPKIMEENNIVIAERYFYDYILNFKRKNLNISERFVWWTFRLFVPKPTACVLLTNDPDEILKRRQELTKGEIVEFLQRAEEVGRKTTYRFIKIKTDKPLEEVTVELARWVFCNKL